MKYQRQLEILQYINDNKKATVKELMNKFNISKATLNRDLSQLEKEFSIKKVHGGVISNIENQTTDFSISQKEFLHREEKIRIAQEAVKLIHNNQTIILDSGSTIWYLANELSTRNDITGLTVITHDLKIAYTLASNSNISLYVLGGTRQSDSYDLFDPNMFETLNSLNADIYFMATSAFDSKLGVTHFEQSDVTLKQAMMKRSSKIILCSDSSKYGIIKRWKLCELSEVNTIVSDYNLDEENLEALKTICEVIIIKKTN